MFRPSLFEVEGTGWLHRFQSVPGTENFCKSLHISRSPFPHPYNEGVNTLSAVCQLSSGECGTGPVFPLLQPEQFYRKALVTAVI